MTKSQIAEVEKLLLQQGIRWDGTLAEGVRKLIARLTAIQDVEFLSTKSAARVIDVSPITIKRWVDAGRLTAYRLPTGELRFKRGEVLALVTRDTPANRRANNPFKTDGEAEAASGAATRRAARKSAKG